MAKKEAQSDALQELKKAIREKRAERLYFFHGEEAFLRQYYLDQLRKILTDELTEAFNFHKLNNENFSLQALIDGVEAVPMMAETTFLWVDDIDIWKFPEDDRNRLVELFSDIPDYCTVVFTYETVAWKPDKRYKKLWEAVEKNGAIVEFPKQEQKDLIPWIGRHFAAHQKRINPDLCVYLMEITGGTMTALAGEIGKICAYSGAEEITRHDIDMVVEPVLDAVVFQMTDLLGAGEYGKALLKLQQLLKMQQEPIAILGAVGGHFRKISTARILQDGGKQAGELARLYGMSEYAARKTMDTARRFSHRFCARAAELIMETDRKLKTSYDDPKRLLEALILTLAQEGKNG